MSRDRLVIGVCTFNRGPKLLDTLATLAALRNESPDGSPVRVSRIVVVDNNCTDGTAERVLTFAAANRGIPIELVAEPNQGLSAARRRVLLATVEPLIAFVDDDCLVDAGWATACLAVADASPRVGAVGGRVMLQWESGPTPLALACATQLAQQDHGDDPPVRRLDGEHEFLVGAAIVLRRRAVEETGWLGEAILSDRMGASLVSGGDTELCVRLRSAGWELWYQSRATVEHLIPPGRQTAEYLARLLRGIGRSEPMVQWLAAGRPGLDWITPRISRAASRYRRTRLLEWRPQRRFLRLHQRAGRLEGWKDLESLVRAGDAGATAPPPTPPRGA
jgi:GT2 family glycosyltransferase